jgi:hypothetical protein
VLVQERARAKLAQRNDAGGRQIRAMHGIELKKKPGMICEELMDDVEVENGVKKDVSVELLQLKRGEFVLNARRIIIGPADHCLKMFAKEICSKPKSKIHHPIQSTILDEQYFKRTQCIHRRYTKL